MSFSGNNNLLDAIGNTPMVRLRRVVPGDHAEVWIKLEGLNPTGSYKDRMAVSLILSALDAGRLDGVVPLECTGGSTGTSVAFVCAALGLPCAIVTSDAFSRDKTDSMRAFGADVIIEACDGGKITPALWQRMWDRARGMQASGSHFWLDQFHNPATVDAFGGFAEEILRSGLRFDAFCAAVGTAGMLVGTGRRLRVDLPEIAVVAVEPVSSAVLSGNPAGPHTVDGTAAGFVPPHYDSGLVDQVIAVLEDDARHMCRQLAKEEGIFAGTSTGLNVCAAIQLAAQLGSTSRVVTVACDSGFKYMSGNLFRSGDA